MVGRRARRPAGPLRVAARHLHVRIAGDPAEFGEIGIGRCRRAPAARSAASSDRGSRDNSARVRSSIRAPTRSIEPLRRGVAILTRGVLASTLSRAAVGISVAGVVPPGLGAATPGVAGVPHGRCLRRAGLLAGLRRRRRCPALRREEILEAEQDHAGDDDRENEIFLIVHRSVIRMRRNRVVAAAAPGVAAHQPFQGENDTAQRAVLGDRFLRVMRAARLEAAGRQQQRRDQELIGADEARGNRGLEMNRRCNGRVRPSTSLRTRCVMRGIDRCQRRFSSS